MGGQNKCALYFCGSQEKGTLNFRHCLFGVSSRGQSFHPELNCIIQVNQIKAHFCLAFGLFFPLSAFFLILIANVFLNYNLKVNAGLGESPFRCLFWLINHISLHLVLTIQSFPWWFRRAAERKQKTADKNLSSLARVGVRTANGTVDLYKCHSGYVTHFVDANQDTLLAATSASANIATYWIAMLGGK